MARDSTSRRSRHNRHSNGSSSSSRRNKKDYDGLTIFVRRADNLRNGDMFGKSDPYVSCTLSGEVAKTHKIRNTLNPVWEDELFLPWTNKDETSLTLHVIDWDEIGFDSLGGVEVDVADLKSGRTLELEMHLKPMVKRDNNEWRVATSEDTGKVHKAKGTVFFTLKLAVEEEVIAAAAAARAKGAGSFSNIGNIMTLGLMGGSKKDVTEKKKKKSAPHEGVLVHLDIVRARGLPNMDQTTMSDPYVKASIGRRTVKTKYKSNTLEPVWKESFKFKTKHERLEHETLYLDVYDRDLLGSDDFMGRATVGMKDAHMNDTTEHWLPLSDRNGKHCGDIQVVYTLVEISGDTELAAEVREKFVGSLKINVIGAHDMPASRFTGKSDPYVLVELGHAKGQTPVAHNKKNPVWDVNMELPVYDLFSCVTFQVYDKDKIGNDDFLGAVTVPLLDIQNGKTERFFLKSKSLLSKAPKRGSLDLKFTLHYDQIEAYMSLVKPPQRNYLLKKPKGFKISILTLHVRRIKAFATTSVAALKNMLEVVQFTGGLHWGLFAVIAWAFVCLFGAFWQLPLYLAAWVMYQRVVNFQGHTYDKKGRIRHYAYPEIESYNVGEDAEAHSRIMEQEGDNYGISPSDLTFGIGPADLLEIHKQLGRTGRNLQDTLENIANGLERMRNVTNWSVPKITYIFVAALVALSVVLLIVPINFILLAAGEGYMVFNALRRFGVIKPFRTALSTEPPPGESLDILAMTRRVPSELDKQKRYRIPAPEEKLL